jgi:hypothetical protein
METKMRTEFVFVPLIVILLLKPLFAQQQGQAKARGVLANLKVDQAINVKEVGTRYLITVIESESALPMPHTIQEIGPDYIVIRDLTGLNETCIPIYSIQAVVNFKGLLRK